MADLVMFFKILRGFVDIPSSGLLRAKLLIYSVRYGNIANRKISYENFGDSDSGIFTLPTVFFCLKK